MDGTTNLAGAAISALVIIGWIPLAFVLIQQRGTLGRERNKTGWATVAVAIFNGLVNLLRYTGRLPDHTTYLILNDGSLALYVVMFFLFLRAQRKSYPVA